MSLPLGRQIFTRLNNIGLSADEHAAFEFVRDSKTVDAELDTRLTGQRKHAHFGWSRPYTRPEHGHAYPAFSTRLHILGTTILFIWTALLTILIVVNENLRSVTTLATLLVMITVSALLAAPRFVATSHSDTNPPAGPGDKPQSDTDRNEPTETVLTTDSAEISSIASTFRQMTDRLDSVTLSVNYLSDIISSLSIGLLVIDEHGQVRMANPAFRTMAGFPAEGETGDHLLGMRLATLFEKVTGTNEELALTRAESLETTLNQPDGNVLPVMLVSTPLPESGPVKGAVCTVIDLSEQKRAQAHVRAGRERIESLVQHLHEIQETERSRIARDLHDDLGAILTALRNGLVRLGSLASAGASAEASDLVELADKANISVDRVIRNLWPQMLDHFGLGGALEVLATEFETRHGIATVCNLDIGNKRFDRKVELALYRTSQEALTNIARHARARNARVSLVHAGRETLLEVSDDGRGFAKRNRQNREGGYGLLGMRQRIAAVNGELSVETGVNGSKIIVKVPPTSHQGDVCAENVASALEG